MVQEIKMSERLLEHKWGFLQLEFRPLGHTTFHNTAVKNAEWPEKQGSDSSDHAVKNSWFIIITVVNI